MFFSALFVIPLIPLTVFFILKDLLILSIISMILFCLGGMYIVSLETSYKEAIEEDLSLLKDEFDELMEPLKNIRAISKEKKMEKEIKKDEELKRKEELNKQIASLSNSSENENKEKTNKKYTSDIEVEVRKISYKLLSLDASKKEEYTKKAEAILEEFNTEFCKVVEERNSLTPELTLKSYDILIKETMGKLFKLDFEISNLLMIQHEKETVQSEVDDLKELLSSNSNNQMKLRR